MKAMVNLAGRSNPSGGLFLPIWTLAFQVDPQDGEAGSLPPVIPPQASSQAALQLQISKGASVHSKGRSPHSNSFAAIWDSLWGSCFPFHPVSLHFRFQPSQRGGVHQMSHVLYFFKDFSHPKIVPSSLPNPYLSTTQGLCSEFLITHVSPMFFQSIGPDDSCLLFGCSVFCFIC